MSNRYIAIGFFFLVLIAPLACKKSYQLNPQPVPTVIPTLPAPTFTSTPTSTKVAIVTTLAGQAGVTGATNATGNAASFYDPLGVAVDSTGIIYVADAGNNLIRKISTAGVVTTLAGQAGVTGSTDSTGTSASFSAPSGVAVDSSGFVYVADTGNSLIRKISTAGVVTTLAGQAGVTGSTDAVGTSATFYDPCAITVDSYGNVYVADWGNSLIRKISSSGVVTTICRTTTSCAFHGPHGIMADHSGNIYLADSYYGYIWDNNYGYLPITPHLHFPYGIVINSSGIFYTSDPLLNRIGSFSRSYDTAINYDSTDIAGTGSVGSADGPATSATFNEPSGIAIDTSGNIYVADRGNQCIRKIQFQ